MNPWKLIDLIITLPASMAGYVYQAYLMAFRRARNAYVDNYEKYSK